MTRLSSSAEPAGRVAEDPFLRELRIGGTMGSRDKPENDT